MFVLVEVPKHELLVKAALDLLAGRDPFEAMTSYVNHPDFNLPLQIDVKSGAVAIGDGEGEVPTSLDQLNPEHSNRFVVRGSVKASSVKEIPQRIGRGKVYSDPPISRLLTCGKSHKVGDASDVQDDFHLRTQKLWDQDLDGS